MTMRAALTALLLVLAAGSAAAQTPTCTKPASTSAPTETCTIPSYPFTVMIPAATVTLPVYHDTVRVQLPAPPAIHVTDTLYAPCMSVTPCTVIVAPPPPPPPPAQGITISLLATHQARTITDTSTGYRPDSLSIQFAGSGSASIHWVVTHTGAAWWNLLTTKAGYSSDGTGVGPGVQHWSRNTGQHAGVYVDTFWVSAPPAAGSPAIFLDSLIVLHNGVIPPPSSGGGSAPPAPPPVPLATITPDSSPLAAHPRVWMTPARVTLLKQSAATNTLAWQRVKNFADAELTDTSANVDAVPSLCLVYLATGNASYATKAGSMLARIAVDTNTIVGDSYYYYRFGLPEVTAGLDWCYAGLTPALHTQVASWLMDRADAVWPETNPSRAGGWGVADVENNYYWGFMFTGPAALAAYGDDPRAAYHRGLVESHWTRAAVPFFATDATGGAWLEGTGYDSGGSVARIADAYLTAGTPLSATPFLSDALTWQFQQTTPDFLHKAVFGDQARASDAPIYTYDRARIEDMLPFGTATQVAQAYAWMHLIGQQAPYEIGGTMSLVDELLRFDPSVQPAANLNALPLTAMASGPGYVVGRASHATTATYWTFHDGAIGQSHQSQDDNALMIWKQSGWVFGSANLWSYSGIEQATADYSTLTLDTLGQLHNLYNTGQSNGGSIVATQLSDTLAVVRGQAANAYSVVLTRPVTDYLRTMVYIPSLDAFAVVDRVAVTDSTRPKVFRWHTHGAPILSGQTFTATTPNKNGRCVGQLLTPATLGQQAYHLGSDTTTVTSYAVTVTTKASISVTVIQCGMLNPVALNQTTVSSTLTIGGRALTIPIDANLPVQVH